MFKKIICVLSFMIVLSISVGATSVYYDDPSLPFSDNNFSQYTSINAKDPIKVMGLEVYFGYPRKNTPNGTELQPLGSYQYLSLNAFPTAAVSYSRDLQVSDSTVTGSSTYAGYFSIPFYIYNTNEFEDDYELNIQIAFNGHSSASQQPKLDNSMLIDTNNNNRIYATAVDRNHVRIQGRLTSRFVMGYCTFNNIYSDRLNMYISIMGVSSFNSAQSIKGAIDSNADKIIDSQEQARQQEKKEINESQSSAVDDSTNAIEDKTSGFIESLSSLVNALSYNGVDCNLHINGLTWGLGDLIPTRTWFNGIDINFKQYIVTFVPAYVLQLIQNLCTIGLIVFCVRELYTTIFSILGNKGENDNE